MPQLAVNNALKAMLVAASGFASKTNSQKRFHKGRNFEMWLVFNIIKIVVESRPSETSYKAVTI